MYRPIGSKAWAQDTPQRETACMRVSLQADQVWGQLGREHGDPTMRFSGPVLAVKDDRLVWAYGSWDDEGYSVTAPAGELERRGRRWYGTVTHDPQPEAPGRDPGVRKVPRDERQRP